jgi:signal transduction histidine kinase
MKIFTRIFLNLLPLALVPLVVITALSIIRGNRIIEDLAIRNAELELDFFKSKCSEEARLLDDLGVSNIDFYKSNAVDSAIDYAENRVIPGSELFVLQDDMWVLGSSRMIEGSLVLQTYFEPWNWTLGIAVSNSYLAAFNVGTVQFSGIILLPLIVMTGIIGYFISRKIAKPIVELQSSARKLSEGDLSVRAPVSNQQELRELALTFNAMAESVERLTNDLGKMVRERTEKLEATVADLKRTQQQLIDAERLSALGQLSAGVAHELNTPLGAIQSSNETIIELLHDHFREAVEYVYQLPREKREIFNEILSIGMTQASNSVYFTIDRDSRKDLQVQLKNRGLHDTRRLAELLLELGLRLDYAAVEKLLQLPQTQIKNLLSAVSQLASVRQLSEVIRIAVEKSAVVVTALRRYIRKEDSKEIKSIDIISEIETVLTLMQNKMKYGIDVIKDFQPVRVLAAPHELSQVWINLIDNALFAMDYQGTLTIKIEPVDSWGVVKFIDTGPGVPEEIRDHIFDPFFTTKAASGGIGLGLDICRRIIEQSQGRIELESIPGRTEFSVWLPISQKTGDTHG